MTSVSRTFTVTAAPGVVIDYLKDFGHAEEWDPGTVSCTREGDGPIEVGARWRNVSKLVGVTAKLVYTLDRLTEDTVRFVGRNDRSTSTDTITVRPDGSGSRVTYRADLQMHGAAVLITPVMRLIFEKLAGEVVRNLTKVLDALS